MTRPRMLDLFSGAGGAAVGYHRAGFEVVGVDINPQPRYPFEHHVADALTYPLDGFDAVHASPPCHDHSTLRHITGLNHGTGWMLDTTIRRLQAAGVPWVVENVENARIPDRVFQITLCGSSFGLQVRRHRRFASNVMLLSLPCRHRDQGTPLGVYGHGGGGQMTRGVKATPAQAKVAMGIDWMTHREISQAIPPAYTEWIGGQLLAQLEVAA